MQLIIWVLAGTSALNTLTIFYFIIRKCMSSKRNPDKDEHEYAENVIKVHPFNSSAANFKNPIQDDITDEVIYDEIRS